MSMEPVVTRFSIFSMQVCVPTEWTDEQAVEFANGDNPSGTEAGWVVRKEGDELLQGRPERVPCDTRTGCVHIMLDC